MRSVHGLYEEKCIGHMSALPVPWRPCSTSTASSPTAARPSQRTIRPPESVRFWGATLGVPADVEAALGTPRRGGLFTLHHSPDLTILNVVWAPGMAIYPHEHRMWAAIGLYGGREDNTFYRRGARGLEIAGGKQLGRAETALLDEAAIHSVVNPLSGFTGAIHVYGGDFFGTPRSEWSPDTLEERPFDVERTRRVYAQANKRDTVDRP